MPLEPFVDHGVSQQFGLFAATVYHFSVAFNVLRMNGYDPLVPFDPGADRISYSPVFHSDMIALSFELGNARIGGGLITLEVGRRNTHCRDDSRVNADWSDEEMHWSNRVLAQRAYSTRNEKKRDPARLLTFKRARFLRSPRNVRL
jgi:hypothetical protein